MLRAINQNAERWALLLFYTVLVLTMAIEVIRREVFSYSSFSGEEIVRYSFIYLVWIGAASAVKERAHIRIDVLFHSVGPRTKAALYILGDLVMLSIAVIALYWSFETVGVSWQFGSVTDGLRISKVWFLMAVPLGFALIIFRLLQSLLRDFGDLIAGRPVFEGNQLFD
ncbi:MAG: TRAP transporter small permease [Paracoccus sp. (in: a-proteobacteria)]